MVADLALAGVAAATLAVHCVLSLRWSQERARLVDVVISRGTSDLVALRRADVSREARVRTEPKSEPIEQIGF